MSLAASPDVAFHGLQGSGADVVLDALGVGLGVGARHPQRQQKIDDEFMPLAGPVRQSFAFGRQEDGAIGLRGEQALALEAGQGLGDRDVRDAQPPARSTARASPAARMRSSISST